MERLLGEFTNVKCILLYDIAMGESFYVVKSGFKDLYTYQRRGIQTHRFIYKNKRTIIIYVSRY